MQLRDYQQAAIDALYRHLRERDDNPVIVIPTGAGKTPVIATICQDAVTRWQGRVLVLAHVKELLQQAVDKLRLVCPDLDVGVYSAGLKRRDTEQPVVVAGIQSVYQKACDLGPFDLILIDEAHMLPPDGDGMFRRFLNDAHIVNPHVRVIGLTATPYRLKSGTICGPEHFLNAVCYEIGVKELIRDGFLSPLVSKNGVAKFNTDGLHVRGGEFVPAETEALMDQADLVAAACREIVETTTDRNSVLIFAAGVEHGQHVQRVLQEQHGVECGFVCGETPSVERDELLARFRGELQDGLFERQPLKYLVNVAVLTTGFDAPNIDCVVLLRPTMSPGLYCLDESTEILSKTGWKRIGEINVGDLVAGFNTEDESIRFVPASGVIERTTYPNENFVSLETPATSIRVTDLHRLVIGTRCRPKWRAELARDTYCRKDGVYLPKAGHLAAPGVPLSDDELRFIGWVMTDGSINKKNGSIHISQSIHQPWVGEIQRVIQACGFKHSSRLIHRKTEFSDNSTVVLWTISKGKPRGRDKHLRGWGHLQPWLSKDFSERLFHDIDDRQFAVLLHAIHLGDGSKQANQNWTRRSYHIGTANQLFAERLQICGITRGYRCTLSKSNSHDNDFYFVRLKKGTLANVGSRYDTRPSWRIEQAQNERVWCVENELGTIITRRNGRVTILGNCQMTGRGFRLHPGKVNCLILDYGGNVLRHGPVDQLNIQESLRKEEGDAPAKECPECRSVIAAGYATCPDCGHEFPPPEKTQHAATASHGGVLSGEVTTLTYEVRDIHYHVHQKRDAAEDAPRTMRVDYRLGLEHWQSEWICFEHHGWARRQAERWWKKRSPDPVPETAQHAVDIAGAGGLATVDAITVRSVAGEKYDRIVDYQLGPMPEPAPALGEVSFASEDVPF